MSERAIPTDLCYVRDAMKPLAALVAMILAGCSALPESGPRTEKLAGALVFPQTTAHPPGSVATIKILPIVASGSESPIAETRIPARTGDSIPFSIVFPADRVKDGGEHIVLAQIIDHGVVRWSNLTQPLRVSFAAEPSNVQIPLRPEP